MTLGMEPDVTQRRSVRQPTKRRREDRPVSSDHLPMSWTAAMSRQNHAAGMHADPRQQ